MAEYIFTGEGAQDLLHAVAQRDDADAGLQVLAASLAAMAHADDARSDAALAELEPLAERPLQLSERIYLLLQLTVFSLDRHGSEAALSHAREAAIRAEGYGRGRGWTRALSLAAQHNLSYLSFSLGRWSAPEGSPAGSNRSLDAVEVDSYFALRHYLDRQFQASVEEPYRRIVHLSAGDDSEQFLTSALLRANCLADLYLLRDARRVLGRYRFLASAGRQERNVASVLELMARAHDVDGLSSAIQLVRRIGPLQSLAQFAQSTAAKPWSPQALEAALVSIRDSGDVLPATAAEQLVPRLINTVDQTTNASPALRLAAVDALLIAGAAAGGRTLDQAVVVVLDQLHGSTDPVLNQHVASQVGHLPWGTVGRDTRDAWLSFAEQHLPPVDDRGFVAEALAWSLVDYYPDQLRAMVRASFNNRPTLMSAAFLVAQGGADDNVRAWIAQTALETMRRRRDDAAAGKFEMGGDPVPLLARTVDLNDTASWAQLTAYLLDPHVATVHKAPALSVLVERASDIPPPFSTQLADGLASFKAPPEPLFGAANVLAGATLRLLLALRAVDEKSALARLLELAGERSPDMRIEALRSYSYARNTVATETLATLALPLSYDPQELVRGEAGRALADLVGDLDGALRQVLEGRLADLLAEAGVQVPYATLVGIRSSRRALESLTGTVKRLAAEHPSLLIRQTASSILEQP